MKKSFCFSGLCNYFNASASKVARQFLYGMDIKRSAISLMKIKK